MFLFLLKNLYPYPRIGVFLEIAYPCIRYVSYLIHVSVSVHPSFVLDKLQGRLTVQREKNNESPTSRSNGARLTSSVAVLAIGSGGQ